MHGASPPPIQPEPYLNELLPNAFPSEAFLKMEVKEIDIPDVISKLTLEEKAYLTSGKDFWHTYPVHRLGVPSLRVSDGPYGVRGTQFTDPAPTASIPSGSVLACSWNTDLMYELGKMMGDQTRAKGAHLLLGPTINMARSPLSGRSFESLGEDPILTGYLASAMSKGIKERKVMICPKHLVCNDKEDLRLAMNVELSERALREIYLLPFMIVQKHNDPESYMTSYNKVRGKHGVENEYVMKEIVQKEWGFKGCFMSDWFGTVSCAESLNAGTHLEMPGPPIWRGSLVTNCVYHNTITEQALNEAVRGVLTLVHGAAKTGLPEDAEEGELDNEEVDALARQAGKESLVLLKNEGILPLQKKKVLVIGLAAKKANFCAGGACTVNAYHAISLYDAMVENLGESNVDWVMGAPNRKVLPSLALYAKDKTKKPIVYRTFDEPRSVKDRKVLTESKLPEVDIMMFEYDPSTIRPGHHLNANFQVTINVPESAKWRFNLKVAGLAQVFIDGKNVATNDNNHKSGSDMGMTAPVIFEEVYLEEGKDYLFEIDFKSTAGSGILAGCLACGLEKAIAAEDYIKEASELAKKYEQVVVVTGLNKDFETEGIDRKTMDLPPYQDQLVESVLESNPNAVVVIESGTAVTLPWEKKAKALLHSGYLGQELGNAMFDVIFGDYNPSGKLSYTWPKRYEDCSSATSFELDKTLSLTYLDDIYMGYRHNDVHKIEPLFAFGHGLSYTTFKLENLKVDVGEEVIELSVDVKNTGKVDGDAVVQAYVLPKSSAVPNVVKSLKGFTKVSCKAGSSVTAKVSIDKKLACSIYDTSIKLWVLEAGDYEVAVGSSSDKLELSQSFKVEKSVNWVKL